MKECHHQDNQDLYRPFHIRPTRYYSEYEDDNYQRVGEQSNKDRFVQDSKSKRKQLFRFLQGSLTFHLFWAISLYNI